MKEITKEKYRKGIICFGNESFKSPLYGEIGIGVKETVSAALKEGDIEKASSNYNDYKKNNIISFTDEAFDKAEKERSLDEPIDIIDESISDSIENTLFMKPIEENDFDNEQNKEAELEKSFVLPKIDFDVFEKSTEKVEPEAALIADVKEKEEVAEAENEVFEEKPSKQKKLSIFKSKKSNKAAYVDTVILCLVAQLTIFGILILVLLMIK